MGRRTLTLLVPVTRDWTRDAFLSALGASDVPRGRAVLIFDAPCDSGAWIDGMEALGFTVEPHHTGNTAPSDDTQTARDRHLAMRRLSQTLVGDGPLLCLEDDTLVPPDVHYLLQRAKRGRKAATGVQASRHGTLRAWGVWKGRRTLATDEQPTADACGHYCLLTDGATYRSNPIDPSDDAPAFQVDYAHTRHMAPVGIAWEAVCGHLTAEGVIDDAHHVWAYDELGGGYTVAQSSIRLPNGLVHWYDDSLPSGMGEGKLIQEEIVQTPTGELYRLSERVVGNGVVLAAPKQLVPIETARKWARCGFITDPALYDPREEVKPANPAPEKKTRKATRPN